MIVSYGRQIARPLVQSVLRSNNSRQGHLRPYDTVRIFYGLIVYC